MLANASLDDLGDGLRMQPAADLAAFGDASQDRFAGLNVRRLDPGLNSSYGFGVLSTRYSDDVRLARRRLRYGEGNLHRLSGDA